MAHPAPQGSGVIRVSPWMLSKGPGGPMPTDLVSRLSETLDELERVATEAIDGGSGEWARGLGHSPTVLRDVATLYPVVYDEGSPSPEQFAHIARWDPKAVLGLVAALRKIVANCEVRLEDFESAAFAGEVLRDLAAGFGITEEG